MKKFEADSLEVAYSEACRYFDCSITELEYEILQYPTKGVLGLFAKRAIIIADIKKEVLLSKNSNIEASKEREEEDKKDLKIIEEVDKIYKKEVEEIEETPPAPTDTPNDREEYRIEKSGADVEVIDSFFNDSRDEQKSRESIKDSRELADEIEGHIKQLISSLCFNIDTVEVDIKDNIVYIFIDGEDAALLIGKEGYRYNALSYLLFNWINPTYGLYIKLEIAHFLKSQEDMIRNYIQPVVEHVESEGWGRTRPLDGILAQIALEQLRERFPNKYVAIKKNRVDGSRYIVINDFIKSS